MSPIPITTVSNNAPPNTTQSNVYPSNDFTPTMSDKDTSSFRVFNSSTTYAAPNGLNREFSSLSGCNELFDELDFDQLLSSLIPSQISSTSNKDQVYNIDDNRTAQDVLEDDFGKFEKWLYRENSVSSTSEMVFDNFKQPLEVPSIENRKRKNSIVTKEKEAEIKAKKYRPNNEKNKDKYSAMESEIAKLQEENSYREWEMERLRMIIDRCKDMLVRHFSGTSSSSDLSSGFVASSNTPSASSSTAANSCVLYESFAAPEDVAVDYGCDSERIGDPFPDSTTCDTLESNWEFAAEDNPIEWEMCDKVINYETIDEIFNFAD